MTNWSPIVASILKFPSKSVVVPVLVFSILTEAPGRGTPVESVTVPVIFCCENKTKDCNKNAVKNNFFMFICSLYNYKYVNKLLINQVGEGNFYK